MACHSALAAGFARFLAGPLMSGALLVRRLAALARDLSLLGAVHRGKSAILFCHTDLPDPLHAHRQMPARRRCVRWGRAATEVPRLKSGRPCNYRGKLNLAV